MIAWPEKIWILTSAGIAASCLAFLARYLAVRLRRPQVEQHGSPAQQGTERQDLIQDALPDERRNSSRLGGPPVEVTIYSSPTTAQPMAGWVVNRSPHGVCFSVSEPLPVGMVFNIRATTASEEVSWTQVVVKHCQLKVHRWLVGGQFPETVPTDVLRLFGYR